MGFFTRMAVLLGLKRKTAKQVVDEIVRDVKAESERQKRRPPAPRPMPTMASAMKPKPSARTRRSQSESMYDHLGYQPADNPFQPATHTPNYFGGQSNEPASSPAPSVGTCSAPSIGSSPSPAFDCTDD